MHVLGNRNRQSGQAQGDSRGSGVLPGHWPRRVRPSRLQTAHPGSRSQVSPLIEHIQRRLGELEASNRKQVRKFPSKSAGQRHHLHLPPARPGPARRAECARARRCVTSGRPAPPEARHVPLPATLPLSHCRSGSAPRRPSEMRSRCGVQKNASANAGAGARKAQAAALSLARGAARICPRGSQ